MGGAIWGGAIWGVRDITWDILARSHIKEKKFGLRHTVLLP